MASAKAKIRHVFGDTFSCRAAPPDILVKLSAICSSYTQACTLCSKIASNIFALIFLPSLLAAIVNLALFMHEHKG